MAEVNVSAFAGRDRRSFRQVTELREVVHTVLAIEVKYDETRNRSRYDADIEVSSMDKPSVDLRLTWPGFDELPPTYCGLLGSLYDRNNRKAVPHI
jgi:hypothetical protein